MEDYQLHDWEQLFAWGGSGSPLKSSCPKQNGRKGQKTWPLLMISQQ